MTRHAACSCGQLHLAIEGEPSRNAMCHCLACQRRTGAVISNQARYRNDQVTITGKSSAWQRTADSGNAMRRRFCPQCGTQVLVNSAARPQFTGIRVGTLDDPESVQPAATIWTSSAPAWASIDPSLPRIEKQPPPPAPAPAA